MIHNAKGYPAYKRVGRNRERHRIVGVAKNQRLEKKSTGKSTRIRKTETVLPADWANADPKYLLAVICCIALRGGAIRLGYTRDGGAYAIGIYGDGEPFTEYVKPSEDINDYLRGLYENYSGS